MDLRVINISSQLRIPNTKFLIYYVSLPLNLFIYFTLSGWTFSGLSFTVGLRPRLLILSPSGAHSPIASRSKVCCVILLLYGFSTLFKGEPSLYPIPYTFFLLPLKSWRISSRYVFRMKTLLSGVSLVFLPVIYFTINPCLIKIFSPVWQKSFFHWWW